MTDIALDFGAYEVAVDALRAPFLGSVIEGVESPVEYSFSHPIDPTKEWQSPLSTLAKKLLAASFNVHLTIKTGNYIQELGVFAIGEQLKVNFPESEHQQQPPLPAEAIEIFEKFERMIVASRKPDSDQSLGDAMKLIAELCALASSVQLSLNANLRKSVISAGIDGGTEAVVLEKVIYYLFVKNLANNVKETSLAAFEKDFCSRHKRSVIVVFDSSELLAGDLLVVCGRGHEDELRGWLTEPLANEAIQKTENALRFRKSESLGDFKTEWLTPEFFALPRESTSTTPSVKDLGDQLRSFRGLLSVLFLADYIDLTQDEYVAEYRGIGVVKVKVSSRRMAVNKSYADHLFQLYNYAYEGFSADKLEIVQQFISLITSDLATLCRKATELQEAVKKTYAAVLRNKVSVYFDAVNKVQERLKMAVDKSAESVISLSRDVSGDVYKVAGIIAAAISVALLKPDFGWPVALTASLVLVVYMSLVIFYHLQTLASAYNLSMQQHEDYIKSFKDALGSTTIDKYLVDPHLRNARELFTTKQSWAVTIYTWCLLLSSSVALAIVGYKFLTVK